MNRTTQALQARIPPHCYLHSFHPSLPLQFLCNLIPLCRDSDGRFMVITAISSIPSLLLQWPDLDLFSWINCSLILGIMKKGFGLLALLIVVFFVIGDCIGCEGRTHPPLSNPYPPRTLTNTEDAMTFPVISRKLMNGIAPSCSEAELAGRSYEPDDYGSMDPVPSSMASIRPGPIQHGTPLMPYVPKPSPPPTQP